jgi:hypothetical protein
MKLSLIAALFLPLVVLSAPLGHRKNLRLSSKQAIVERLRITGSTSSTSSRRQEGQIPKQLHLPAYYGKRNMKTRALNDGFTDEEAIAPCPSDEQLSFFGLTLSDYEPCDHTTLAPFEPSWYPCPSEKELAYFNLTIDMYEPCDHNTITPFDPSWYDVPLSPCPSDAELTYFNLTIDMYEPCDHNTTLSFDPSWYTVLAPCPSESELNFFNLTLDMYEPCDHNTTSQFDPSWYGP